MSKAKFLVSIRIDPNSYHEAAKLVKILDRNMSFVLNEAIAKGLPVVGEVSTIREGADQKTVLVQK